MARTDRFWETVPLHQMNAEQWESLCDGCARCCLQKLEDEDTHEVFYTRVVCQYLDENCGCTEYQKRNELVPDCVWLTPEDIEHFHWLPNTCAYRLIAEGKPLYDWHPLITGRKESVAEAGIAVTCHNLIKDNELNVEDWQEEIIRWVEQ